MIRNMGGRGQHIGMQAVECEIMEKDIIIKSTIRRSVIDLGNGVVDVNITLQNGESWTLIDSIRIYNATEILGSNSKSKQISFCRKVIT